MLEKSFVSMKLKINLREKIDKEVHRNKKRERKRKNGIFRSRQRNIGFNNDKK